VQPFHIVLVERSGVQRRWDFCNDSPTGTSTLPREVLDVVGALRP
jgi:hypothetical protein